MIRTTSTWQTTDCFVATAPNVFPLGALVRPGICVRNLSSTEGKLPQWVIFGGTWAIAVGTRIQCPECRPIASHYCPTHCKPNQCSWCAAVLGNHPRLLMLVLIGRQTGSGGRKVFQLSSTLPSLRQSTTRLHRFLSRCPWRRAELPTKVTARDGALSRL